MRVGSPSLSLQCESELGIDASHTLTPDAGICHRVGRNSPSLLDKQEYSRTLHPVRSGNHGPVLSNLRHLHQSFGHRPLLCCLQHQQPTDLPARHVGVCCRMCSFHERVAYLWDRSVGQSIGGTSHYLLRNYDMDVRPMGVLCTLSAYRTPRCY